MNVLKPGVIIASLTLSAGVLYAHATGSLFPGLSVSVFLSIIVLLLCCLYDIDGSSRSTLVSYIVFVVTVAVVLRVYIFFFPASLIGLDTPGYAAQIERVMRTGTTSSISFNFYSDVSHSITLPAIFGLLAGLRAPETMVIYPVFMGTMAPLVAVCLTPWVASSDRLHTAVIAAILASVATVSVRYAYLPIAQSLGIAYWGLFLFLLSRYYETKSKRMFLLTVLVLLALTYTHKLPLFMVSVVLAVFASLTGFQSVMRVYQHRRERTPFRRPLGVVVGLIATTLLLVQWAYITDFITSVVLKAIDVLLTDEVSISPAQTSSPPTAAVAPSGRLGGIIVRRGHGLILLPLGGLAWLHLLYSQRDEAVTKVLLVSATMPVLLLGIGIIARSPSSSAPPPSPSRFVSFLEPVLIPLIAAIFGRVATSKRADIASVFEWNDAQPIPKLKTVLSAVVLVVLLTSLVFSALAVPDFPGNGREYLTAQEAQGKSFGYDYVDDPIYTDWFMTIAGPPIPPGYRAGGPKQYENMGSPLLYGNLTQQRYEYVLYRTNVVYFPTSTGPWKLLWDPRRNLDTEYNRVYANGGALLYKDSPRRSTSVDGRRRSDSTTRPGATEDSTVEFAAPRRFKWVNLIAVRH